MHRLSFYLLVLATTLTMGCAHSAQLYQTSLLRLEVPTGFEGPVAGDLGPSASSVAFRRNYPSGPAGTLLQVTTYDFQDALAKMPESQRGQAGDFYLRQFMQGVERKRTSFQSTLPSRVMLGGFPAARATWSGDLGAESMTGVMYCVVVGPMIVVFHTQDKISAPPENRDAALKAIESVTFAGNE